MTALQSSVAPSLASEYALDDGWLVNDTTDPTGKGPVSTGPVEPIGNPVDGTAPVDLNVPSGSWTEPPQQAPDYFSESAFPHAGPWPALPAAGDGKEPFGTLPDDGITPAGYYKIPPKVQGLTQRETIHPGHDRHSQNVDSAGWEQYTPSGRTAVVQYWEQDYPGVDYYWPVTQPTMAHKPFARGGNQAVNGVVAEYGGIANSGGNTAFEPASPPATSTIPPSTDAGVIPQWGF